MPKSVFVAMMQLKYETLTLGVFSSHDAAVAEIGRVGRLVDRSLCAGMVESWVDEHVVDEPYTFAGYLNARGKPSPA